MPFVGTAFYARVGFGAKESLGHVSKLDCGAIKVGINPVARGIVSGEAGDAFEVFVQTVELHQPSDEGVKPEVAGELLDVLGALAQFREGLRRDIRYLQLREHDIPQAVQHRGVSLHQLLQTFADTANDTAQTVFVCKRNIFAERSGNVVEQELVGVVRRLNSLRMFTAFKDSRIVRSVQFGSRS